MYLEYAVVCTTGRIRSVNEDNFYLNGSYKDKELSVFSNKAKTSEKTALFAVCDGLGGEGNGEEAAFLSVRLLLEYHVSFDKNFMRYFSDANKMLQTYQKESQTGMDCTFVGVFIDNYNMTAYNLGDSRIYRIHNGHMEQISDDHSEFAVMLKYGVFKEEDYYTSSTRNRLTRSVGGADATPYVKGNIILDGGDILLLCSDGLCAYVKEAEMEDIINKESDILNICKMLTDEAIQNQSDDNITVMIIRCS